ncbi:uncharacterized protein H6S33_012776 [Morchella sextelata]|uniref:uncharacterized protein n=1 Tax=Morchella sextelata TaxID=1174677 RepID=UPI001D03C2E2|nr:uncharacterized protein H6S33_012776 [Morchella sextelata]KAH0609290.1 hypothetical protein H6S33_012776 [Morchella sextelata]
MSSTANTFHHPQPWRTFSTPLTIPRPANYNYNYNPYHPSLYDLHSHHYHHHRSNTPPSLSPSPAPSTSTTASAASTRVSIEIEELPSDTTDADADSAVGIELLTGEFEEAPENYRRAGGTLVYDSDAEDDDEGALAASHKSILYGFERLTARGGKRSYAESVGSLSSGSGGGSCWGDSGVESEGESGEEEEGGRRKVRKVHGVPAAAAVPGCGYGYGWEDNEIDMEL